jgi:hypothetical protein
MTGSNEMNVAFIRIARPVIVRNQQNGGHTERLKTGASRLIERTLSSARRVFRPTSNSFYAGLDSQKKVTMEGFWGD